MWGATKPLQEYIHSELVKNEYIVSPPDHMWAYSNLGFSILGAIIERVSGDSYANYIQKHILLPLGMNDTILQSEARKEQDVDGYPYNYFC